MTQKNLRNEIRKNPKLHKLYQKIYYLLYKRHIYGLTSPFRVLPDFIIIGVVRGGTTSLYDNLSKHPCIYQSAYDELGFFDSNFDLGINWYKSLFPTILQKKISKFKRKYFMTYDVTPFYIWNPLAAKRISEIIPNVKLITLLRNPVDRAYSNYQLGVREGSETLSFEDAIKEELKTLNEKKSNMEDLKEYTRPRSYLAKGMYANQLKIWLELFPKQNMLILRSEDFSTNPQKILNEIFQFLNLPSFKIKNYEKKNVGGYYEMKPETRRFLLDFFRPYNNELFRLIGRDMGWKN